MIFINALFFQSRRSETLPATSNTVSQDQKSCLTPERAKEVTREAASQSQLLNVFLKCIVTSKNVSDCCPASLLSLFLSFSAKSEPAAGHHFHLEGNKRQIRGRSFNDSAFLLWHCKEYRSDCQTECVQEFVW